MQKWAGSSEEVFQAEFLSNDCGRVLLEVIFHCVKFGTISIDMSVYF